jgi:hypothetical protein
MAELRLQRLASPWVDRERSYEVWINGRRVGEIANGETKVFSLNSGSSQVELRVDWCRSQTRTVEADDQDRVSMTCRPSANVLTAPFFVYFRRNHYIRLEPSRPT